MKRRGRTVRALALWCLTLTALLVSGSVRPVLADGDVTITGTVVDWAVQKPIEAAAVTVTCSNRTVATTTDADGHFRVSLSNDSSCVVTTEKTGYLAVPQSRATVSPYPGSSQDVLLGLRRNLPKAAPPDSLAPPPPPPASEATPAPQRSSPETLNYAVQHVYFATDRELVCKCAPTVSFNGEQSKNAAVRYGEADVSIPRDHRLGGMESPSFWRFEFRPDPAKHIIVVTSQLDTPAAFRAALRGRIARAPKHDAFVFVHGYNVTFQDALRRTAQMAHDLAIPGPAIAFSWPAKGELADYLHDENNIAWTTPHLEDFLQTVARIPGVSTVRVIAHSMGNRALAEALADFGKMNGRLVHVDDIVLAAPDIDDGRFAEIATAFKRSIHHVTIYASASDKALQASHKVHGYPRVGDVAPVPLVLPGFDVVDVTAVDTDWLGHGYFSTSVLMKDIYDFFLGNEPPRFGLQRATTSEGQSYWRFARQ